MLLIPPDVPQHISDVSQKQLVHSAPLNIHALSIFDASCINQRIFVTMDDERFILEVENHKIL